MRLIFHRYCFLAILFFATSLLVPVSLFAQHKYIPIPEDSAVWITVVEDWHESDPSNPPHTFYYSAGFTEGKDTVINGIRYFCYHGEWDNSAMPPPIGGNSAYYGEWMVQDTIAKKVWMVRYKGNPSKLELIYDFSLNIGDTITDPDFFYFTTHISPYRAWVEDVDSIFWNDGTWRYRWFIKSDLNSPWAPPAQAVQIEGMGYTTGFLEFPMLESMGLISLTFRLTCFRHKNQWLYHEPNPWNYDCDSMLARNMITSVGSVSSRNELEAPMLYPNPARAQGKIWLNSYAGKPGEQLQLEIFNVTGQTIATLKITPGSPIDLQRFTLTPGLYLFIVKDENSSARVIDKIHIN